MNIKDANALKNINKKFDEDPMHIIQIYMNLSKIQTIP